MDGTEAKWQISLIMEFGLSAVPRFMGYEGGCQIQEGVPNSEGGEKVRCLPESPLESQLGHSVGSVLIMQTQAPPRLVEFDGIIFCHFCDYVTHS